MILRYPSGEEIKPGDRILFHGEPGEIELVATDAQDQEQAWYVEQFGGGIMISVPKHFGRVFIHADSIAEEEDLEFVARVDSK